MTSLETIKRIINNYEKSKNEYINYSNVMKFIQNLKKFLNRNILLKIEKEKYFNDLHFLKMYEHYINLRFYHENIKDLSYNEKLLRYFEKVISTKGFDPIKWDPDYELVELVEGIINCLI